MRYNVAFDVTLNKVTKSEFKAVEVNTHNRDSIVKAIQSMYPKKARFNFKRITECKTAKSEVL
jgi:hypothetical protein